MWKLAWDRWRHWWGALGALLLLAVLLVVFLSQSEIAPPPAEPPVDVPGALAVFFTDPAGPTARTLRGGPDQRLQEAIDGARYSVDIAAYRLNLWSIRDALLRAFRRGVEVRMVVEADNAHEAEVGALRRAGIPVVEDGRPPLMHHKFVVIDAQEVWTGSMNFTVGSAYRDDNNLLRLVSTPLAADFEREFEEMYLERRFGALSAADTPYPVVGVNGTRVEVYFSPDDRVAFRLLKLLREAQESIRFMAFSLTSKPLAEALVERASNGVQVEGVVELDQAAGAGSQVDRLRGLGLDVRSDANPGNLHHKVLVIDSRIVVTGSYNFSRSAEERNDENVLILHDPDLARAYLVEFQRVFQAAGP